MKFRSDTDGYITGVRFYKGTQNTGTHVGHLWTSGRPATRRGHLHGRDRLGLAGGDVRQPGADHQADTTYVASYHTAVGALRRGHLGYFASGVDNPPLHALANGVDGPNGVYKYGASGSFPNETFQLEQLLGRRGLRDLRGPRHHAPHRPVGLSDRRPERRQHQRERDRHLQRGDGPGDDHTEHLRAARRLEQPGTRQRQLQRHLQDGHPRPDCRPGQLQDLHRDRQGRRQRREGRCWQRLDADRTWSFTTAAPPPPPPDEGPGGPIAVIGSAENPFGRYYAEILRNEGLNEFTADRHLLGERQHARPVRHASSSATCPSPTPR